MAGSGELTVRTAPVAGFLTGYVESAAVTPFELVKARHPCPCSAPRRAPRLLTWPSARVVRCQVRMQVKEHAGRYASSLACARAVVASEGLTAVYRGFGATCARNTTFNGTCPRALHACTPPR